MTEVELVVGEYEFAPRIKSDLVDIEADLTGAAVLFE